MSELSDQAVKDFDAVLVNFKKRMIKEAEDAISDLYCDLPKYIETDAWMNYRQHLQRELHKNIKESVSEESLWAAETRKVILTEHRDELIQALNQDHLKRIAELEEKIEELELDRGRRDWSRF
jgi:hypothetical protein